MRNLEKTRQSKRIFARLAAREIPNHLLEGVSGGLPPSDGGYGTGSLCGGTDPYRNIDDSDV
ncbi:MAG TPA: hypothetical protein VH877_17595 [Polyangia bacterium]|jgi:hypothetical protein|nr:hypothetical protein [Polyangia bacterium]